MERCIHALPFRQCAICLGLSARPELAGDEDLYIFTSRFERDQEVNVVSVLDAIDQEELEALLDYA